MGNVRGGIIPKNLLREKAEALGSQQNPQGTLSENKTKKKLADFADRLDDIGQKSERKGVKAVREFYGEYERREKTLTDDRLSYLARARSRSRKEYYEVLSSLIWYGLKELEWPFGWHWEIEMSNDGLKVKMTDRWGRTYLRAFKPSGEVKYDEQAAKTIVGSADDTIDHYTNPNNILTNTTRSGIHLPT